MPRFHFKKIDPFFIAFLLILAYLSFLNIMVIKTSPELILLQFIILVIIFQKFRAKEFIKYWIPFIAFFFLYEFLRGFADNYSPFYNFTLFKAYEVEKFIFGEIPTAQLQKTIDLNNILLIISTFFYSMFFYYSFLIAFILWIVKKSLFKTYVLGFLLVSFLGLLILFLIPTAPPWMVSDIKNLGLERYLFVGSSNVWFISVSLWGYFLNGNQVAAFPSLHVAWPAYASIFLIFNLKNKLKYTLLIIPVMISFSVIYTAEHFFIDVVFGWILAALSIYLTKILENRFKFSS